MLRKSCAIWWRWIRAYANSGWRPHAFKVLAIAQRYFGNQRILNLGTVKDHTVLSERDVRYYSPTNSAKTTTVPSIIEWQMFAHAKAVE